jgi:hypothetical protein
LTWFDDFSITTVVYKKSGATAGHKIGNWKVQKRSILVLRCYSFDRIIKKKLSFSNKNSRKSYFDKKKVSVKNLKTGKKLFCFEFGANTKKNTFLVFSYLTNCFPNK